MYSSLYSNAKLGILNEHSTKRGTIVQIISDAVSNFAMFSMLSTWNLVFVTIK